MLSIFFGEAVECRSVYWGWRGKKPLKSSGKQVLKITRFFKKCSSSSQIFSSNILKHCVSLRSSGLYHAGPQRFPEDEFLDKIQQKSSFLSCHSQSPLYIQLCLEISIPSNSCNLLQFLQFSYCTLSRRKEENMIENHTPFPVV